MGYVLLIKNENENSYIDKIFLSAEEAFTFAKLHSIPEGSYQIVTEQEFNNYMQSQQHQQSGYRQTVDVDIIDEEEPQQPPRPIIRNYSPRFIRPVFVGSNKKDRREKNGF